MKAEIIKYAKGMEASEKIYTWLEKHVFTQEKLNQQEVEHIVDYLVSDKAPRNLSRASLKQMSLNTKKWTKALEKKGKNIKESKKDTKVVLDFKDGFKIVKLVGKNAYKREGFLMRHCVSGYYGKDDEIYSLRDKKNMPHATLSKSSQQIKGKGNGSINPKYIKYVVEFLEHVGIEVRDSEMQNLGYINIENIKDDNAVFPGLFKEKYFYKEDVDKIVDSNGDKYENMTLWKAFGLFKFDANLKIKFNFSVSKSLKNFKKLFKNKKDNSQLSGGDDSQLSGGNRSQLSGGYNSQLSGGYNSQLSGGNYSQLSLDGKNGLGIAGKDARIKGKVGSAFALAVYDENNNITDIVSVVVDGKKIKENVFYTIKNGALVEYIPPNN